MPKTEDRQPCSHLGFILVTVVILERIRAACNLMRNIVLTTIFHFVGHGGFSPFIRISLAAEKIRI